jgi:hypothetical protein
MTEAFLLLRRTAIALLAMENVQIFGRTLGEIDPLLLVSLFSGPVGGVQKYI